MHWFHSLRTPPVFPDEEQTRIARLLYWVVLLTTLIVVFDSAILIIFAPETLSTMWINVAGLAVNAICFWLLRRGRVREASFIICFLLWSLLVYYLSISGGVTSPAFGFLNIIIIIAAVLLGARGAVTFGGLCIVTAIFLFIAENNGWIMNQETPPTSARLFATNTAIFLGLAIFMAISANSVRNALIRARQDERDLASQNRQLQAEIVERERAQREQSRLAAILEATSDFVGIVDGQGKTLYVNSAGRKLVGMSPDMDVTQTTIADYHRPAMTQIIVNQALPAAVREGTWSGETRLLTRDGKEVLVSQVIIAHLGVDGKAERFSTIIRDLSEREQAEEQRLELALQRERLEFFKEFLGNISHDLKTPLTVINTSLYLLERLDDPGRQREKIEQIRQQTALLNDYIQDLLALSQLDQLPDFRLESLDLKALLTDMQLHLNSVAEVKKLSLEFQLDTSIPLIQADKQKLYRAFTNLIENALNYTPAGGSVAVQTYPRDEGVVVQVSDTGIGIAPEDLPHIFERFYRSQQAQQVRSSGTGLGLAIVKRIVEIHKGLIDVESIPGAGTTIRVWLPATPPTHQQ